MRERGEVLGKMPGTVHVKVVKARDLPVMDKRSELTDAFVEVHVVLTSLQ